MNKDFWKDKKVLVTGDTGFKGGWLCSWLNIVGANVTGISLEPNKGHNFYYSTKLDKNHTYITCDIRNKDKLELIIQKESPEIVFHLAAKALVRESYHMPAETYDTNVMGTLNILESIRSSKSIKAAVIISSDKCYKDQNWYWGYRETDTLGGLRPI